MISIVNIEFKKELSKRIYEARKRSRPKRCLLCDKEITNLCNSHSVPQFVLKNLAENGKIVQSTMLMSFEDIDFFDIEKGINNSGTFKYICDKLIQLSKEIFQRPKFSRTIQPNYVPVKPDEIPNLLSKEWAIGE